MTTTIPIRVYSGVNNKPASCPEIPAPPAHPCYLTAQLPFMQSDGCRFRSGLIDKTYTSTSVLIDTTQYPGLVDATWEIVVWYGSGVPVNTKQWSYELVDEDGNIYATITTPLFGSTGDNTGHRFSTTFTLRSGSHYYELRVLTRPAGTAVSFLEVTSSIIKLNISASSAWRIEVPMFVGGNDFNFTGGETTEAASNIASWQGQFTSGLFGLAADYTTITGTVPADGRHFSWQLFKKDASKWPADVTWELEVWGMIDGQIGGATFYLILIDNDTLNVVSASEVHVTATTAPGRFVTSFANNATNFLDGHTFRIGIKASASTVSTYRGDMNLYRCKLYASHVGATSDGGKAQIFFPAGNDTKSTTTGGYEYFAAGRLYLDRSKFTTAKTSWFFNQSAFVPLHTSGQADLIDLGVTDYGIASPTVLASFVTTGTDSFVLYSVAIDPTTGDRFMIRETVNFCSSGGRVMAEVSC